MFAKADISLFESLCSSPQKQDVAIANFRYGGECDATQLCEMLDNYRRDYILSLGNEGGWEKLDQYIEQFTGNGGKLMSATEIADYIIAHENEVCDYLGFVRSANSALFADVAGEQDWINPISGKPIFWR